MSPYTRAGDVGLDRDSKAQAAQVRSIDSDRLGEYLGHLSDRLIHQLDGALRLDLDV